MPSAVRAADDADHVEPAGLAQCKKTFQSGTGNTFFKWCFHANGTLGHLEAPQAQQQIFGDQWAVCSNNDTVVHGVARGYPAGFDSTGLNAPTFPNQNTVTMRTSNGRFEVKQAFSQSAPDKNVFINVTVKNLLPTPINDVTFSRKMDFDLNNSASGDLWVRSYASVLVTENNAVSLTGVTWTTPRLSQIEGFSLSGDCIDGAVAAPITGDYAGRVNYLLGNFGGNQTKTFKYRVAQL